MKKHLGTLGYILFAAFAIYVRVRVVGRPSPVKARRLPADQPPHCGHGEKSGLTGWNRRVYNAGNTEREKEKQWTITDTLRPH